MGWSLSGSFRPLFLLFLLHFLLLVALDTAETRSLQASVNSSIPALFVFGDSTVDPGNNNYITTIARSNFPPYGKDFTNHTPTGRFTNGKLITDFLASHLGIKDSIPPYLDPALTLDDLKTGVSFASAGTGYDPLTPHILGVIPMEKELTYFQDYISRMEAYIGKERTASLISNSMFFISAGTNDFLVNYYGPDPIRRKTYNVYDYQQFVLQHTLQFIESLLKLGARKIVVVGLPPIGCLPIVITSALKWNNTFTNRGCIDQRSFVAQDYNSLLQDRLGRTGLSYKDAKIAYAGLYGSIDDMIRLPQKFGFENVNRGCCGSGLVELSILCNRHSSLCKNDSKYVFWDSVHPTEAAYYIIFQSIGRVINQFFPKNY